MSLHSAFHWQKFKTKALKVAENTKPLGKKYVMKMQRTR